MFSRKMISIVSTTAFPVLLFAGTALAQEEPGECVEMGALAYDNWTTTDAGGSGLPAGVQNKDYIRCKACHGWDRQATRGGYVRRSRKDTRPNAGAGDGDDSDRRIFTGTVTAEQILHHPENDASAVTLGRSYADGTGSWVPLDASRSAANTAAHANGFTMGNQHPDFSPDGPNGNDILPTMQQIDCLVEFLNFIDADYRAYFADINTRQEPASLYTIVETADAGQGETFYNANCMGCHGDPAEDFNGANGGSPAGGILAYLAEDGKYSEMAHKARWGSPDTIMTRAAIGDPTSQNISDMLLYLQQEGMTGFAVNPGLTGTWWNILRNGEGFLLEFAVAGKDLILFASFYTYDSMGNQVWLTAQSTSIDGTTVTVDVYLTSGAMWGADFVAGDVVRTLWGTGTFVFTGCAAGSFSLMPAQEMIDLGYTALAYDLTRTLVSGNDCPTPTAN
jgi:mono/diheme cytochrome c family protein